MPNKTPEDYARELLEMYRENTSRPTASTFTEPVEQTPTYDDETQFEDGTGGLQVNVTTLRRLYPVKNALITIFIGERSNMTVIETGATDESGKSGVFNLKTQPRADSQQAGNGGVPPFSRYNILVQSDGYVDQIAMDVPVFSGVISVQGIDLLPVTAAGGNTAPQIIQEGNDYNL